MQLPEWEMAEQEKQLDPQVRETLDLLRQCEAEAAPEEPKGLAWHLKMLWREFVAYRRRGRSGDRL